MAKISVVINTLNEEKNLLRALTSVKNFADEIVVCDMYSDDKTVAVAKKFGAKVHKHQRMNYVEPARNYALSQTTGDWVLVLDADEEIPGSLAKRLKEVAADQKIDYVLIPRKNIIFGNWIKYSLWWPDYLVRFFKKGKVIWGTKIHSAPQVEGVKLQLSAEEENAIIHHNYDSLDQYLERLVRYSRIQAEELVKDGYQFSWTDLIRKPLSEFLSRFFAGEGYKDGLHGLALALLQAFSEFIVYVRVWEKGKFKQAEIPSVFEELKKAIGELEWWIAGQTKNPFKKMLRKFKL